MPNTLQNFLADSAQRAATELEAALLRLPEAKRNWSPADQARTALDLVAECALLNLQTAGVINDRAWPADFDFAHYEQEKTVLTQHWGELQPMLHANTATVMAAIRAVPDEDLEVEVQMPWGPMTLTNIIAYPYWNMSYHLGQINYIASILGCLS